jgi:flagellar basal body rod protein FlgC
VLDANLGAVESASKRKTPEAEYEHQNGELADSEPHKSSRAQPTDTVTVSRTVQRLSAKKRRTEEQPETVSAGYVDPPPVIICSGMTSVQDSRPMVSVIERLGGKFTTNINNANILCIPEGAVKCVSPIE